MLEETGIDPRTGKIVSSEILSTMEIMENEGAVGFFTTLYKTKKGNCEKMMIRKRRSTRRKLSIWNGHTHGGSVNESWALHPRRFVAMRFFLLMAAAVPTILLLFLLVSVVAKRL